MSTDLHVSPVALAAAATSNEPTSIRTAALGERIRRSLPNAIVLVTLAGLAIWGLASGWKMPKFSWLLGGKTEEATEWCEEHNVPESECIECDADLVPQEKDHGWCKEHGIEQCPLHFPDVAQLDSPAPPSKDDFALAARALETRPRDINNRRCDLFRRRIQFASADAVDKTGVEVEAVDRQPILETIDAPGQLIYDPTRVAHITSRATGIVWRVEKSTGDPVRRGETLALIDAVEVGKVKADLLQAISQSRLKQAALDRLSLLSSDGAVAARQIKEAKAALEDAHIRLLAAQQTLANLGLPAPELDDLNGLSTDEVAQEIRGLGLPEDFLAGEDQASLSSNLYPIRAPFDGEIVERHLVVGEVVGATDTLFTVADVRRMYLMLDLRQEDARYVTLGQKVLFSPNDDESDEGFSGEISWLSTSADEKTRTVKVRVELPNSDRELRANTFGVGRIVLRDEPQAIVVPQEAVHWDGCCNVVFVRDKRYFEKDAPKFFHVRQVRLGAREGDLQEIAVGLTPGEVIATTNSVVLAAQLMKSSLGEGCGHAH